MSELQNVWICHSRFTSVIVADIIFNLGIYLCVFFVFDTETWDRAEGELTNEDEVDDSPKPVVVADEDIEEGNIPVKPEHGAVETNADIANSVPTENSQGVHFEREET